MEPNSTADRYIGGHGMSFGLEDQKPQLKPPSSPLGLFFPAASAAVAIRLKPLGPKWNSQGNWKNTLPNTLMSF
jgi:hypothetical protein